MALELLSLSLNGRPRSGSQERCQQDQERELHNEAWMGLTSQYVLLWLKEEKK